MRNMLVEYSICQPRTSYDIAGSVNSKSVFEALIRSVPPRLASDEPDFAGALALAAPAKLDATSKPAPTTAMAIESVSFLCIGLLPSCEVSNSAADPVRMQPPERGTVGRGNS